MSQDPALLALFHQESSELIKKFIAQLDTLKSSELPPSNIIEELFRIAHSLKGNARLMRIETIEKLAHSIEDDLQPWRKSSKPISIEALNSLSTKIETLPVFLEDVVQNRTPRLDPVSLKPLLPDPLISTQSLPPLQELPTPLHFNDTATIRIPSHVLTQLMEQLFSLNITHKRLAAGIKQIEDLQEEEMLCDPIRQAFEELSRELYHQERLVDQMNSRLRTLSLVPLAELFAPFYALMQDLAFATGKQVSLVTEGEDLAVDRRIIEELRDPLVHLLRNAITHGIETPSEREAHKKLPRGQVRIIAQQQRRGILIEVSDDGKGLDLDLIKKMALMRELCSAEELKRASTHDLARLIFLPGFSTASTISDLSGRGVGMDIVQDHIHRLGGTIKIDTAPGEGCLFSLEIPTSRLMTDLTFIKCGGTSYALASDSIEAICGSSIEQYLTLHSKPIFFFQNQLLDVYDLKLLIEDPKGQFCSKPNSDQMLVIVHLNNRTCVALLVDQVLEVQRSIITPPNLFLAHLTLISGITLLQTGEVCLVLNLEELLSGLDANYKTLLKTIEVPSEYHAKILIVDDSLIYRRWLKKIFEDAGYAVGIAFDGVSALEQIEKTDFDVVITDIDMQGMDGITLTSHLHANPQTESLPVIIYSAQGQYEGPKALLAGAKLVLDKSSEAGPLLAAVRNLIEAKKSK